MSVVDEKSLTKSPDRDRAQIAPREALARTHDFPLACAPVVRSIESTRMRTGAGRARRFRYEASTLLLLFGLAVFSEPARAQAPKYLFTKIADATADEPLASTVCVGLNDLGTVGILFNSGSV